MMIETGLCVFLSSCESAGRREEGSKLRVETSSSQAVSTLLCRLSAMWQHLAPTVAESRARVRAVRGPGLLIPRDKFVSNRTSW
eukprot:347669-Rhodomonas_salina.1